MATKKKDDAKPMSWDALNDALRDNPSEAAVVNMLEVEMNGHRRMNFINRLHSKYNVLRTARERVELAKGTFKINGK